MNLSPAALLAIHAQAMPAKPRYEDDDVVEEVIMYRCPVCDELHEYEHDAELCCEEKRAPGYSRPACPICGVRYDSYRDAADCCLWHDLDAATRWKVADAVESGADWAQALGVALP